MKRSFIYRVIVAIMIVVAAAGCSGVEKLRDIKVTDCTLSSITPQGLRALKADLLVKVDNPAVQLTLDDIQGKLYYNGDAVLSYSAPAVTLKARTEDSYTIPLKAHLLEGVSLLKVLQMLSEDSLEGFTTDVSARAKLRSGLSKEFSYEGLPLEDLAQGGFLQKQ